MPSSSSSSSSAGASASHARSRASKGSSSISSVNEVTSTGTSSSSSSPASATKAAAITRQSSIARKRSSVGGGATVETPSSRRAGSISMSRNGLSSSSSGGSVYLKDTSSEPTTISEDPDMLDNAQTPDELSRLTRDQLVALIVRERQDKDDVEAKLSTLSTEHATISESHVNLVKAQALHESKVQDAYTTTERLERELSEQMETLESTKEALREAERASCEFQKRFNDQVELFESEQAKWTEVEQSLYNQISQLNEDHQSLLAKKHTKSPSVESQAVEIPEGGLNSSKSLILSPTPSHLATASPTFQIPETTLEELQHLHMRVADLSSEQAALQAEVLRLENELEEVQRVNSDLQEQNENYEVLLSERMLAGLNAFTDSGNGSSLGTSGMQEGSTTGSRPPSSLDRLEEEEDGLATDDEDGPEVFESSGDGNLSTGAVAANMTPNRLNKTAKKRQSMMGLGGGLDLEAELDRARREEEEERQKAEEKAKRKKDRDVAARRRANQSTATIGDGEPLPADVETLRKEVKLLRQENKGLSTYVSKILEKIIGIEGFEKVLSVEKDPKPVSTPTTAASPPPPPTPAKTGTLLGSTLLTKPTPLRTPSMAATPTSNAPPVSPTAPIPNNADNRKKNRFSMDWFGSSLFKGSSTDSQSSSATAPVTTGNSAPAPGLKPMRLTGGPPQKSAAVEEDEDDRRTRARLQSEMRLLGIETTSSPATQGGSPGSVKIGGNRSPGQRGSSGSYSTSPLPPHPPPKEADFPAVQTRDTRPESSNRSSELSDKSADSPSGGEAVKIRGHRKRPSASFAAGSVPGGTASDTVPRARPTSIGLGLTYSKDSPSTPTWVAGSPSLKAANSEGESEERRSSAPSQI